MFQPEQKTTPFSMAHIDITPMATAVTLVLVKPDA
ncbi:unannotated protein [freshwater metagenome]|uniref:Unannotated protein n=1 Tax=freshwater metagenome TaxID=449393 RepID=A0A6J6ETH8_9ZZZZ